MFCVSKLTHPQPIHRLRSTTTPSQRQRKTAPLHATLGMPTVSLTEGLPPNCCCSKTRQGAIEDAPQALSRWSAPPPAAPYVPAVPVPALVPRVETGVAAGESERPSLVAGTDEAASKALRILDTEFSRSGSCVQAVPPPEAIKRESVAQQRWVGPHKAARSRRVFLRERAPPGGFWLVNARGHLLAQTISLDSPVRQRL